MVRAKGIVLTEKTSLLKDVVRMLVWWDEIDKSEEWQRFIFYSLSASYALISFVALVQLCRIQLRVPEYGWTTQKIFHLMNFVVNGLRAVLFCFYKTVFLTKSKARSLPINKLRPAYYIINGFIYFTQACIWISIRLSESLIAIEFARVFISIFSLCAASGFILYGGRLFLMLRRFPIESRGRQKKLFEVGFVTGICCTCFMLRCLMVMVSAFDEDADIDVLDHPLLNLIYYMLVEILPSALVLFILRKLPPRRVSEQYHPIK